jgi:hypothetical protein
MLNSVQGSTAVLFVYFVDVAVCLTTMAAWNTLPLLRACRVGTVVLVNVPLCVPLCVCDKFATHLRQIATCEMHACKTCTACQHAYVDHCRPGTGMHTGLRHARVHVEGV